MNGIQLRVATPEDAAALVSIYAPYVETTAITFEYEVPSVCEFERRIRSTLETYPYLVALLDGRIVAYAYAGHFTSSRPAYSHSAEISIYADMQSRRQGVGRKLYETMEHILSSQGVTDLFSCIAVPMEENQYLDFSSQHFHEHLGYHLCGHFESCGYKFSTWFDMIWMGKCIGEHPRDIHPFRPFPEIREELSL